MGNIILVMRLKMIFLLSRVAAFLLDYIIFYLVMYGLSKFGVLGYAASLLIFFLYRYITTAQFGATLGMLIVKLRLKRHDYKICLKREIYRFASAVLYLGYAYAIIDPLNRTLHDLMAGTYVISASKQVEKRREWRTVPIIARVLLVVSVVRWSSLFILNDIGLVGLRRVYTSDVYYQSFEGDNLVSLSQDELYMKTLGRRYTTVVDMGGELSLIRISNKLTYTEFYRLVPQGKSLMGQYMYRVDMPIQFICSGKFKDNLDFCGISPQNIIILVDSSGFIYGRAKVSLKNVLTLGCGDVDGDGTDESVVLGRGGDIEIYKYSNNRLNRVYSGKIGEDIIPETFYVEKGIVVVGISGDKRVFYSYDFKDKKFVFKSKKYAKINNTTMMSRIGRNILISHIYRNNMAFRVGRIQRLEMYDSDSLKRLYNFGGRTGRRYAYYVRTLENTVDIDGDGIEEIVLKAVGRDDVMGQGYVVEVYKTSKPLLIINRILSAVEDII